MGYKKHTKWKRVYPNIIGHEFIDTVTGMGIFKVLKAWKCREYIETEIALDGTNWFDRAMVEIETQSGLRYRIPFCPWVRIKEIHTGKNWNTYFDEEPWV